MFRALQSQNTKDLHEMTTYPKQLVNWVFSGLAVTSQNQAIHPHQHSLHTPRGLSKLCSISAPAPAQAEPLQYAWGGFRLDPCASWVSSACLWWLTEHQAHPLLRTFCGWGILQQVRDSNIFPVQQILSTLESNFYWICNPFFSFFSPLLILSFKPFTRSSLSEGQRGTVDRTFGFKRNMYRMLMQEKYAALWPLSIKVSSPSPLGVPKTWCGLEQTKKRPKKSVLWAELETFYHLSPQMPRAVTAFTYTTSLDQSQCQVLIKGKQEMRLEL